MGQSGPDQIDGGLDDDILRGGLGNDTIRGSLGKDRIFGGSDKTILSTPAKMRPVAQRSLR